MLSDIVLDTCVLKHASDPRQRFQQQTKRFLDQLLDGDTLLAVDPGFSVEHEAENRSRICSEYLAQLVPGELGYELVAYLAKTNRIHMVPSSVPRAAARVIQQKVVDRTDHVFVKVAYNSTEKLLATHDTAAFPSAVCRVLMTQIAVSVLTARSAAAKLQD